MIAYLIRMTLCTLLLYVMYVLLLERETMHRFKRIYLLAGLIFSILVPFTALTINISQMPANIGTIYTGWNNIIESVDSQPLIIESITRTDATADVSHTNYSLLFLSVYLLITLLFLIRLLKNCWQMLARGRKNACADYHGARIALIDEKSVPHSFGRYIFINREEYRHRRIPDEIMRHEWMHVRQGHTWDIVFIELLIAFGWFHPVFYLYRNKIRQNHEFLADDAVIKNNRGHVAVYQTILMNYVAQISNVNINSNFIFNFLFTKKRIVMMYKITSKKRAWCKSIALIPVLIAAIFVFSTKIIAQNVKSPVTDNSLIITCGTGVSQELLTEYQEIVSKYLKNRTIGATNENDKFYWNSDHLQSDDWSRLYVIFFQMNDSQKEEQIIKFYGAPRKYDDKAYPPPQRLYDYWRLEKSCNVWMDGEKVENNVLNAHETTDFDHYFISSMTRSENKYAYRVDLWTKAGFEKFSQQIYEQAVSIDKMLEIEPVIRFVMEKNNETYIALEKDPMAILSFQISGWRKIINGYDGNNMYMIRSITSVDTPSPLTYH